MTERPWLLALAQLSDSFHASVAELLRELRAGVVGWAECIGWFAIAGRPDVAAGWDELPCAVGLEGSEGVAVVGLEVVVVAACSGEVA